MDHTTFTIWDPTQPNAKMKIINIPGQGPAQLIETVAPMGGTHAAGDQIILQAHDGHEYLVNENEIGQIDQIPPENLIYMAADDGSLIQGEVVHVQPEHHHQHHFPNELIQQHQQQGEEYMECEVTEEVITDDWVQTDGQECVQVTVDQLGTTTMIGATAEDDMTVPLPTDQDEYTASRPYPCDFCSRRFRKKANLMNHMVAHSNDRPHMCNLCGARYMRRCDLLNHLKQHAYIPDDSEEPLRSDPEDDYDYELPNPSPMHSRRRSVSEDEEDLLAPVPVTYKAPPPPPARAPKRPRPKAGSSKPHKKTTTSSSRSRHQNQPLPVESKFNASIEPFVNLPPRFPVTDQRKPFVCQKCGVSFAREKALASHYRIHGGDSQFECETCGDRFWDRAMLQDHIRQRHAASLVASPEMSSVVTHYVTDAASAPQMEPATTTVEEDEYDRHFYCDSCGTVFERQEQLKRHIKLVHAVKEQKYEPISQIVRQRQLNQQHVEEDEGEDDEDEDDDTQQEENEVQQLSCNVCGDKFAEALDLLAHAEVHARFEPHKCALCKRSFLDETAIKEHVQQIHGQELTETSCVVCGKFCKNQTTLLKHAWEHSRERSSYGTHCCSKCGKSFHNKARLKRHMVSHRNKAVKCEICSEEFPDGRSLMNHRHSHTKTRQFPCHECGKTFGSRSSQQIHLRIHSGERPYGCRFCWKAFADGGTLRKHERVHTGEKPYGCSVCPRAFNQRVVLREHIRSHHSAPDIKRGNPAQPFYCSVCSDLFETSAELIKHLIQHSDVNTAMKRQPPTFPRKYKRRRKLKPEEIEKMEERGTKSRKKNNAATDINVTYAESPQTSMRPVDEEDLLKNPAELLLEYGSGNPHKKLIASPKFIDSYELLASASASRTKPTVLDDSGINLLSNVVLVNGADAKPIKTESPKRRGGGKQPPPSTVSNLSSQPGTSSSGSRPRMIHTQKTRVPTSDGKRKTKTVITKGIKTEVGSTGGYSTLPFKRSKTRTVPTYREIPPDKISSESFPLLDDGQAEDDADDQQEALDALSTSVNRHQQEVPSYEDLHNQNLLMEISRKDKYIDKFNSDIVNDLEEILRSPIKNANNNVPPAIIMATPKASHQYSTADQREDQFNDVEEEADEEFIVEADTKSRRSARKQQFRKVSSRESAQRSLTSALRSQRLTRRQLEREVNFLREAYTPDFAPGVAATIKQEKQDSPDKLSAMLLNDIQPSTSSSSAASLINPKIEPQQELPGVPCEEEEEESVVSPPIQHYQCEMCSAVFADRAQLLLHVPIHI